MPKTKGWRKESARHALASKGVRTKSPIRSIAATNTKYLLDSKPKYRIGPNVNKRDIEVIETWAPQLLLYDHCGEPMEIIFARVVTDLEKDYRQKLPNPGGLGEDFVEAYAELKCPECGFVLRRKFEQWG